MVATTKTAILTMLLVYRFARMKQSGEATATTSVVVPPGSRKGRGVCGSTRRSCTEEDGGRRGGAQAPLEGGAQAPDGRGQKHLHKRQQEE